MRIIRITLLFFIVTGIVLSFDVDTVQAQTPEPTWEPIWETDAPEATEDFTCPAYGETPVGYGQNTPEPWWNINCANCMLTQTPNPNGTATATPTPVPYTPTSVPANHLELSCYSSNPTGACTGQQGRQITLTWGGSFTYGTNLEALVRLKCIGNCTGFTATVYYEMNCQTTVSRGDSWTFDANYNVHRESPWGNWASSADPGPRICTNVLLCPYSWQTSGEISGSWVNEQNILKMFGTWHLSRSAGPSGTCTLKASLYPISQPTSTPVPTGTPVSSYCSSIPGGGGGGYDFGGVLPDIRVGPSTCMTIDEFEIDLSSWPIVGDLVPLISFPGFEVCLKPVDFGSLTVFGLSISLDLMATFMAGVFAVRLFKALI